MSTVPVNGFILAGGQSSRMGRDKALLDWHGRTLVSHMIHILGTATDEVQVVGRDPLPDRIPGRGPLSGIATALEVSSTDTNLILAVDLPFLTKDFLLYFRSQIERSSRRLFACKIGSHFPLCLGVRKGLLSTIEPLLLSKDWSVHAWITTSDAEILSELQLQSAGFDNSIFRNLNTPDDYEKIRGQTASDPEFSRWPSSVPGVR